MPDKIVSCTTCFRRVKHSKFGLTTKQLNKEGYIRTKPFQDIDDSHISETCFYIGNKYRCNKCGSFLDRDEYFATFIIRVARNTQPGTWVAVVGSRRWKEPEAVKLFVKNLPKSCKIVTGGAIGPDTWAKEAVIKRGMRCLVISPDYKRFPVELFGKDRAPYERNYLIAKCCASMAAFPNYKKKGGTNNTMGYAWEMLKPVKFFFGPVLDKTPRKYSGGRRKLPKVWEFE